MNSITKPKFNRIGEMEFLRFIFSVIVVLHHSKYFLGNKTAPFINGAFAVEFFFILSGFLMMKSLAKISNEPENLGKETAIFIKNKYLGVFTEVLISWIIGITAVIIVNNYSFKIAVTNILNSIWEVGLLTMAGVMNAPVNDAVWYLSSMLICMAILYPLIRKYKSTAYFVIIPIITALIYGWFIMEKNSLTSPFVWTGLTYTGNLRAFADLGVGIILYHITETFKSKNLSVFSKILLTIAKYVGIVSLVNYMYDSKPSNSRNLIYLIVIAIVIGLIFSEQTYGKRIFNNGFFVFLGKFSLPLYLSHYYWGKLLRKVFPKGFDKLNALIIYFAICLITALVVMVIADFIRKQKPFSKLRLLFVK